MSKYDKLTAKPVEVITKETKLPEPSSIKPASNENQCEIILIKDKEGFWRVESTAAPLTIRDRNEATRQLTIWWKRYQRKLILDNHAKQRELAEKGTN